ncbi:MAG: DUF4296 domain-containing protein [Bacteroidales bacterium]|nr:DUF4296 domain-containing protein [Bacteroidales bacterium]
MKKLLSLLAVIAIFSSCYNQFNEPVAARPDKLIHPDTMVLILVDMELTESVLVHKRNYGFELGDQPEVFFHSIFKKYNVNRAQFDSSMAYYKGDIETMNKIYEDVITRLSVMHSEAQME